MALTILPMSSCLVGGETDELNHPKDSFNLWAQTQPKLEFTTGYFFFTDSKMRKIYTSGGLDLQLAGSYPIAKGLDFYSSIEYLEKSGRSIHGRQRTSIWQIPVNIGIRPVIKVAEHIEYYLGLGPRYFYLHQHNHSSYVPKNRTRSSVGFFLNTGFHIYPSDHFFINLFGQYAWEKANISNSSNHVYGRRIQVGGVSFGAGLGYAF
jgi:outer membrane protein W